MVSKTVEQLKRYYTDLTDEQLKAEYRYRMGISTRMLGCNEVEIVLNTRRAVIEVMKDRGIEIPER